MILQKPNFLRSHPSVTIKPTAPAPRFENSGCFPYGALGERNANCSHNLKVANPARLVPLTLSGGSDAKRRWGDGTEKWNTFQSAPPTGSRGSAPGTPLVTFVVKRKSPGCRAWQGHALAERPLVGSAEGQRPSHIGSRRGPRPCKKAPRGDRRPPSTYTPKRTKSCIPTCNPGREKSKKGSPLPLLFCRPCAILYLSI